MSFVACGVNYQTAPIGIREKIAILPDQVPNSLHDLMNQDRVREAAILSTCHRTELYCEVDNSDDLGHWLHNWHRLPKDSLTPYLYFHEDQAAVRHLLRVASGLDSMVLGEPQILGQIKTAYSLAQQAGSIGKQLQHLFQHVFSVSKQVRTDTAIGVNAISVAYAAVQLANRIFTDLSQTRVLLIGAGETIELVAHYFHEQKAGHLRFANRTLARAQRLARRFNGVANTTAEALRHLAEADIVVVATASSVPILGKGRVETALKIRKHRPMLMIDLAVPRNIETEVGQLTDAYLFTVDDLQDVIQENLKNRQLAAKQAEQIIDLQACHFMRKRRSLDSVPTICAYRDKLESVRNEELNKALRQLKQGKTPEMVMGELARMLTNKLMHMPTKKMNQAAYDGQLEILDWAKYLFDLKE